MRTPQSLRRLAHRWLVARRVAAYRGRRVRWLALAPAHVRQRLRLEVPPPGQRRVEIGSGWRPTPGYVHVEPAPGRPLVDLPVTGEAISLPQGWADEVLSVHVIEHIVAGEVQAVLRHWHGLLRPGGELVVHTPNVVALADVLTRYDDVPHEHWWAAQNALFGYGRAPQEATKPDRLGRRTEHLLAFSYPALRDLLTDAGFHDVRDISGTLDCQHQKDWADVVPGLCLEVRAFA